MKPVNRYILQYIINHGYLTIEKALKYSTFISNGEVDTKEKLLRTISDINDKIIDHGFKITPTKCDIKNEDVLVYLNLTETGIMGYTTLTNKQLEYCNMIIKEILESNENRVTFIQCINFTSHIVIDKMTRDEGQKTLSLYVQKGYFSVDESFVYLGPRLILQFPSYLKGHAPNSTCNLCNELVFSKAKNCTSCGSPFHDKCINTYLRNQNNCPNCKNTWNHGIMQIDPVPGPSSRVH